MWWAGGGREREINTTSVNISEEQSVEFRLRDGADYDNNTCELKLSQPTDTYNNTVHTTEHIYKHYEIINDRILHVVHKTDVI